jgi:hypothetical protein
MMNGRKDEALGTTSKTEKHLSINTFTRGIDDTVIH